MPDYELPPPESIPALYREHGMRPAQRTYGISGCGCLETILAMDAGEVEKRSGFYSCDVNRWAGDMFGENKSRGLRCGFDGVEVQFVRDAPTEYVAGYAYGSACWQACVSAGLTGESE